MIGASITRAFRPVVALLAWALFACSAGESEDIGVTVIDSAGVPIVENTAQEWREGGGWRLSAEPALTIGVQDGPDEYQFYKVTSALRFPDGRFVIANRGTQELRFFDANGVFLNAAGREGGGPEEFGNISRARFLGSDSLLVFDFGNLRFSVWSASGEFGRTFRLDGSGGYPVAKGVLGATRLLVETSITDASQTIPPGLHRDATLFRAFSLDGEPLGTLGRFPGSERYGTEIGGSASVASVPFGLEAQVTVAPDRWFYGSSETYEIQVLSPNGTLQRIIRRSLPVRRMPADFATEWKERQAGRFYSKVPLPETLPAYGQFIADAAGNLWVEEYRLRTGDSPEWAVFDQSGRFLGVVEMPAGGRIMQIGEDFVLGVWRDELEVEIVRMYRLEKPGDL